MLMEGVMSSDDWPDQPISLSCASSSSTTTQRVGEAFGFQSRLFEGSAGVRIKGVRVDDDAKC